MARRKRRAALAGAFVRRRACGGGFWRAWVTACGEQIGVIVRHWFGKIFCG